MNSGIDWRDTRALRIAVVGSGVSGLVAASQLADRHAVTLIESAPYVGGHTNTVGVWHAGVKYAVDTGFIVFNERTYPNFIAMLASLGVASQPTTMSFSVRCERSGLEYNGATLNRLFAQRRNLLRPRFYRMLRDILRFNRAAPELLARGDASLTLGEYLAEQRYSREFVDHYLVPMGAAIWSARPAAMLGFPALFFVRFFSNHGMLSIDDRPTWRVVSGGSRSYVERLLGRFPGQVRTSAPVASIRRFPDRVEIRGRGGDAECFDAVVIATHSDTALSLLDDASVAERSILGAIPYQRNTAVLHTDQRLLPRRKLAWAAWNYHVAAAPDQPVAVTYDMNALQGLTAPVRFLVTLNADAAMQPESVLRRIVYHHPIFTPAGIQAQARIDEINGVNRTFFCGAYWGFGFHEDGVKSGLTVAARLGIPRRQAA